MSASGSIRTGLIGKGIGHSRSPDLHMAEASAWGVELSYELFDLDGPTLKGAGLAEVLASVQGRGFAGVNVTYPFKQEVIPLLDDLAVGARRLGAVNTVVFRDGRAVGYNTDWSGFKESFEQGLPGAELADVVQLGAGGAGAAVAYAMLSLGARRLTLIDHDRGRAEDLAAKLSSFFENRRIAATEAVEDVIGRASGLINATPVGMLRHPGMPLAAGLLRRDLWVADVVYVPIETELLRAARSLGAPTLDGGGMAVFQAADAFELFTGLKPDAARMRARFLERLIGADAETEAEG